MNIFLSLPIARSSLWETDVLFWSRFMQFAASIVSSDSGVALDREFEDIIKRENATISKICFSYANSVADYDDLMQDAYINIWRGMKQFRNAASQRTWVYRVTINSCISTIRKQNRHMHDSLDKLYSYVVENDDEKESLELIHRIVGNLGWQERATIMMWLDEMSYEDIAEAMGINRNTVATRIRRIKDKIAKQFKNEELL